MKTLVNQLKRQYRQGIFPGFARGEAIPMPQGRNIPQAPQLPQSRVDNRTIPSPAPYIPQGPQLPSPYIPQMPAPYIPQGPQLPSPYIPQMPAPYIPQGPQLPSPYIPQGPVGPMPAPGPTPQQVQDQINQAALLLAQQMARDAAAAANLGRAGRTYTPFDMVNDVISKQTEIVSATIWSTGTAGLSTMFTSSAQTQDQRRYYVDILNAAPGTITSQTQFSIAYGHALGSGSQSVGQLNDSPSRAIYAQYKQLLLSPEDTRFTTDGSGSTDSIYAINFKRSLLKERLDPGNFELPLAAMTNETNITNKTGSLTASGSVITLIDDSSILPARIGESGRIYNIVSGSINNGVHKVNGTPVYYGLAYPDYGTLILDGKMLDSKLNFRTNTGSSSEGNNHFSLYHSISGSNSQLNPASDPYSFIARNTEKITSTHYFVRIKNAEYNFSNNPSYVTGSVGQIAQSSFIGDPKTYITTIGLYSERQELLAVAKLSKPLLKSFQREALIRVKLDY